MRRGARQCNAAGRGRSTIAGLARPLGRPLGGTGVEWVGVAEAADAMHRRAALLDGDEAAIGAATHFAAIDGAPFVRIGTAGRGRQNHPYGRNDRRCQEPAHRTSPCRVRLSQDNPRPDALVRAPANYLMVVPVAIRVSAARIDTWRR